MQDHLSLRISTRLFCSKVHNTAHRKSILLQYSTKMQAFAIWSIYILLINLACCIGKKSVSQSLDTKKQRNYILQHKS